MFFPIRTDRRLNHTPWVNYSLVAVNSVIFLMTANEPSNSHLSSYWLNPMMPKFHQFITYQFLHAGWEHLLGNMLFLYVFGNSVEDRLGKVGYLCFYLAGGVMAGLGHALVDTTQVLGASGSVSAVTGAYLVLFPMSNVTIVYWFIFIGAFEISSVYLIGFQIAQNIVFQFADIGRVAYLAHLSGYAYGLTIALGLLRLRLLPREPYDLLTMLEHKKRRAQFASLTRKGYQPWHRDQSPQTTQSEITPEQQRTMDMRAQISDAARTHRLDDAARTYMQLLALDATQVMGQQLQLDVANQLMSQEQYDDAAQAYELFLGNYKNYAQREQIELILGLIYARYLQRLPRAKDLLSAAIPHLNDPEQKKLAQQTLQAIPAEPSDS